MTDVDPTFPRYRIPETTIDGPRRTEGELEFRLICRPVVIPDDEKLAAGEPIQVFAYDFAGPFVVRDPGPLPDALLDACAERASDVIAAHAAQGLAEPSARDLAAAVLMEIGRRLRLDDDEASSLAIGVAKLDVEKLTNTGDEMVEILRMLAPDEPLLRREQIAELLARWKGQAHRDWSDFHALERET